MRVSYNWLKEFVDIEMPSDDLAHLLTMSGLEVEAVEPIGQALEDIIVAKILSIEPHPKADRLLVCMMDTGDETVPVVCGAPNLETGALVPMAGPGIELPGGNIVREVEIRGQRSCGMILAEDEMGLTDDHSGIMILSPDLTIGSRLVSLMPIEDYAMEIAITPNRPDCTSIIGIAREIAALTGKSVKYPEIIINEGGEPIKDLSSVTIDDPVGCPRYAAGMIKGIEIKPSPFWMRYRLQACGVRGISNIVDVSNYVMLEMGQPLHAFDYERLQENRIVVKRAKEGDIFTTLDGKTHKLNSEALMICDGKRPVALAGIMGGLNSEIFEGTKNVLIESAFFHPITIRRGSKRLGLSSEASYRFERGIDIGGVTRSLKRAMMLMSEFAGGEIMNGIIDQYPTPYKSPVIALRVDKTNQFLGTDLSNQRISSHLKALEMEVESKDKGVIEVTPPTFRVDITREVDLMEEIARIEGYDKVPTTYPAISPSDKGDSFEFDFSDKVRDIMVGLGFSEIISYSFISPEFVDVFNAPEESSLRSFVKMIKPLTVEQSVMRTSLLPGLINTVETNIARGESNLKLFEWGKVFIRRDQEELPHERPYLAAIMTGLYNSKSWYMEERNVDFYDIKGAVEGVLRALGFASATFQRSTGLPGYNPDIFSEILHDGSRIGHVGQIAPDVLEAYEIKTGRAFVFEIDMQALTHVMMTGKKFKPFAKFPAVYRDISLIVSKTLESSDIEAVIKSTDGDLIESVDLFDLYQGEKIDPSEKVLNFKISYRSREKTLDGKDINQLHEKIIEEINQKTGGRLREN